jgi:branched-subunit amino acid ABC-type transport system permease component
VDLIVTQALNGFVYGSLLFLLAAGLSLIFGLMGVVNLAHGSFFMLGSFFGVTAVKLTGSFWLATLLAPIPVTIIAILIERFFLRRLYAGDKLDPVLLTFGFSFIITDVTEWAWGKDMLSIQEPRLLDDSIELLGGVFPLYRLVLVGFVLFIAFCLWIFVEKTRAGAMVRAGVDDAATAIGIGLNVPLLLTSTFASGAALAALAGVIAGPILGVYSGIDVEILIPAFIVVVIGGMGSLKGAFVGSLLIGEADTFGKAYLPEAAMFLIYLAMIVILLTRPSGLFGRPASER